MNRALREDIVCMKTRCVKGNEKQIPNMWENIQQYVTAPPKHRMNNLEIVLMGLQPNRCELQLMYLILPSQLNPLNKKTTSMLLSRGRRMYEKIEEKYVDFNPNPYSTKIGRTPTNNVLRVLPVIRTQNLRPFTNLRKGWDGVVRDGVRL